MNVFLLNVFLGIGVIFVLVLSTFLFTKLVMQIYTTIRNISRLKKEISELQRGHQ